MGAPVEGWISRKNTRSRREHALQGVQQRPSNVGGVSADPGGGKAEKADKIVDAALNPLDLIGRAVELDGHAAILPWISVLPGYQHDRLINRR